MHCISWDIPVNQYQHVKALLRETDINHHSRVLYENWFAACKLPVHRHLLCVLSHADGGILAIDSTRKAIFTWGPEVDCIKLLFHPYPTQPWSVQEMEDLRQGFEAAMHGIGVHVVRSLGAYWSVKTNTMLFVRHEYDPPPTGWCDWLVAASRWLVGAGKQRVE